MRHQKRGRKLSRGHEHRRAMLGNLATSVLQYNRVETGHAKALEVRRVVERLITYAKKGDLHSRRLAAVTVKNEEVLKKLFSTIAPQYKERNGGYTRVIKKGFRSGDAAPVSIIELVGLAQMEKEVSTADTAVASTKPAKEKKSTPKKSAKKDTKKDKPAE